MQQLYAHLHPDNPNNPYNPLPFFEAAIRLKPNGIPYHFALARHYHQKGQIEESLRVTQSLARMFPYVYHLLKKEPMWSPDVQTAVKRGLQQAIDEKIAVKEAHRLISAVLADENNWSEAIEHLEEALAYQREISERDQSLHSAIRLFLVAETNPTTKALIFDDLHWVDPASVDFLTYFVTAIDHSRIMLVLIARDFGEQPALQGLLRVQKTASVHSVIVDLKPLSIEENRLLVDELLPESMEGADTLKDLIVQRSAGNPYYAEELVRLLLDYDGIFRSGYTYQLTKEAQARLRDVPGTLQDLILTRFDRLPEDLRGLLLKASILGYSFNIRLLRCLVDTNDEDLEEKIYDLEERDYLIDADEETSGGYAFKHPLIQDSIYNTLLKIDLNRLHLMAAQAIDEDRQMLLGERNEQLAHHYARSSMPEKAIPHLLAAAENALQRFANDVAVTHFEDLLALVGEQIKLSPDQHGRVKIGLGKALKLTGGFGEAKRFLPRGCGCPAARGGLSSGPRTTAGIDRWVQRVS